MGGPVPARRKGPAGPRTVWHRRVRRADWGAWGFFAAAAAAGCAALAGAMGEDVAAASRARAEQTARTLVAHLAATAASPGSDLAGTLPALAASAGPGVRLAVLEERASASGARRRHYLGHSEPGLAGAELRDERPGDGAAFVLLRMAVARREGDEPAAAIRWEDGRVSAAAVARGTPLVAAVAEGIAPPPPGRRPLTIALAALLLLLLAGASLADVLPRLAPVLNLGLLSVVLGAVSALGAALQPGLWRGDPTGALVQRARELKLADLARALAAEMPPAESLVTLRAVPLVVAAVAFYVLALLGLWRWLGRGVARHRVAYAHLAPSAFVVAGLALVPLGFAAALAFSRPGPGAFGRPGWDNFRSLVPGEPGEPNLWQTLATTGAFAAATLALLVVAGLVLGLALERVPPRARRVWSALLLVPWAVPASVAAIAWRTLLDPGAGAFHLVLGRSGPDLSAHAAAGFLASVAAAAWLGFPLMVLAVRRGLERVPREVLDQARLDGLGLAARLRRVTLPLLRPALVPAAALAALWAYGLLAVVALAGGGATETLPLRALRVAFESQDPGPAAAWVLAGAVLAALWAAATLRGPHAEAGDGR